MASMLSDFFQGQKNGALSIGLTKLEVTWGSKQVEEEVQILIYLGTLNEKLLV
jgi:hypothetical protein